MSTEKIERAAALLIRGFAPTVSVLVPEPVSLSPPTAVVVWSGYAPTVSVQATSSPYGAPSSGERDAQIVAIAYLYACAEPAEPRRPTNARAELRRTAVNGCKFARVY